MKPQIRVGAGAEVIYLPIEDILYIEGCNNYTYLHTAASRYMLSTTMGVMTISLGFIRINRSESVNPAYVRSWQIARSTVSLTSGKELSMSRRVAHRAKKMQQAGCFDPRKMYEGGPVGATTRLLVGTVRVNHGSEAVEISIDSVSQLIASGDGTKIVTEEKTFLRQVSMGAYMKRYPNLIRVNRSVAVNPKHVKRWWFGRKQVEMTNGYLHTITPKYESIAIQTVEQLNKLANERTTNSHRREEGGTQSTASAGQKAGRVDQKGRG